MMSKTVASLILAFVLVIVSVECNSEGDILYAWKIQLLDPHNVLESWDPTMVNPCPWFHVTCNNDNQVTRVDLGNAGLSGTLIPQLGRLSNLQYLQVENNNLSGSIPAELGNLTNLISLGLWQNKFSGAIPSSLGNLRSLRFMRVNSNMLTGNIPTQVLQLVQFGGLQILNVSDNYLAGTIRHVNATGLRISSIIQDPKA